MRGRDSTKHYFALTSAARRSATQKHFHLEPEKLDRDQRRGNLGSNSHCNGTPTCLSRERSLQLGYPCTSLHPEKRTDRRCPLLNHTRSSAAANHCSPTTSETSHPSSYQHQ